MGGQTTSDQIDELLSTLTEAAASQALTALNGLPSREADADHDRGARSVESLMRVAATASSLRAKLQKDAADHAQQTQTAAQDQSGFPIQTADVSRLADLFDAELIRIRKQTASALAEGGAA